MSSEFVRRLSFFKPLNKHCILLSDFPPFIEFLPPAVDNLVVFDLLSDEGVFVDGFHVLVAVFDDGEPGEMCGVLTGYNGDTPFWSRCC